MPGHPQFDDGNGDSDSESYGDGGGPFENCHGENGIGSCGKRPVFYGCGDSDDNGNHSIHIDSDSGVGNAENEHVIDSDSHGDGETGVTEIEPITHPMPHDKRPVFRGCGDSDGNGKHVIDGGVGNGENEHVIDGGCHGDGENVVPEIEKITHPMLMPDYSKPRFKRPVYKEHRLDHWREFGWEAFVLIVRDDMERQIEELQRSRLKRQKLTE